MRNIVGSAGLAGRLLVIATLVPAVAFGPPAVADGDAVPDQVESEICGRAAIRNLIATAGPVAGRCVSSVDYEPPGVLPDEDGDFLPDPAEPPLCSVESQNTPADGWCSGPPCSGEGTDYTLPASGGQPPSYDCTIEGDHVMMNGPGTLDVTAPDGQTFHGENPSTCCGTTTTTISAGVVANGTWYVQSQLSCCGGRPQYFWSIAGWRDGTGFICAEGQSADLWLDYDNRSWSLASCHW